MVPTRDSHFSSGRVGGYVMHGETRIHVNAEGGAWHRAEF